MTTDELRDRLAVLCGWVDHPEIPSVWWRRAALEAHPDAEGVARHPFPPNDYNALIAAWPRGWEWERVDYLWLAYGPNPDNYQRAIDDTGDEYADRLRLTVAVLEAIHP
jgi:hypothetical protein